MSRRSITAYLAAAALAVSAVPLAAQEKQSGARPNSGGQSSGSAVSRPSEGGGSSSSGSSQGGGAASRPSGGSSAGSGSSEQGGAAAGARERSGPRSGDRAVSRSGSSSGDRSRVSGGTSSVSGARGDNEQRAVPRGARPRVGRDPIGSAVERGTVPGRGNLDPYSRYSYYYRHYPYGYYWPGYGYGLGYFYDPWMWGSPYGYGYYDPYSYGYGGGGGYAYSQRYAEAGSVRLKVNPNDAQVFVDGYFMGDIDSFDGVFQKLTLESGAHRIEIRAEGYEPVQFEVMIVPGETITYKGDLKRIQ